MKKHRRIFCALNYLKASGECIYINVQYLPFTQRVIMFYLQLLAVRKKAPGWEETNHLERDFPAERATCAARDSTD